MILIFFEQVDNGDNDENSKRLWRHKGLERKFLKYLSANKKSWDTGIWDKELKNTVGNIVDNDDECFKRVIYVLQQRLYFHATDAALTKGEGYYLFEE